MMSNEFSCNEETVHLAGNGAAGPVYTMCSRSVGRKIDHALYFSHKHVEQRAPRTTMLSEDALVMFSEDGITVNLAVS